MGGETRRDSYRVMASASIWQCFTNATTKFGGNAVFRDTVKKTFSLIEGVEGCQQAILSTFLSIRAAREPTQHDQDFRYHFGDARG